MTSADARSRLEVIPYDECIELLARGNVGRLGGVWNDEPHIVVLNYRWDGVGVVFRTDPGVTLQCIADRVVVFEVDDLDRDARTGWSVIARGRSHEISETEAPDTFAGGGPAPWAPGARDHWVRLSPAAISGRRITRDDDSVSQWWRLSASN